MDLHYGSLISFKQNQDDTTNVLFDLSGKGREMSFDSPNNNVRIPAVDRSVISFH